MNRFFTITGFLIIVWFASCTPAQTVSGTYSGTFTGTGIPNSSGSATIVITENGTDNVNMSIQTTGNPEYTAQNVGITKQSVLGVISYILTLDTYPWSLGGLMYLSNGQLNFTLSNDTSSFYLNFSGIE